MSTTKSTMDLFHEHEMPVGTIDVISFELGEMTLDSAYTLVLNEGDATEKIITPIRDIVNKIIDIPLNTTTWSAGRYVGEIKSVSNVIGIYLVIKIVITLV